MRKILARPGRSLDDTGDTDAHDAQAPEELALSACHGAAALGLGLECQRSGKGGKARAVNPGPQWGRGHMAGRNRHPSLVLASLPLLFAACSSAPSSGRIVLGASEPTEADKRRAAAHQALHARYIAALEVRGGSCGGEHPPPNIDAFGISRHGDVFWCAGESEQCWPDLAMCEQLSSEGGSCAPSPVTHCFVDSGGCGDDQFVRVAYCYRSADACERGLPIFGAAGAQCNTLTAAARR